jgi:hypothetical protein
MEYSDIENIQCAALSFAIKSACGAERDDSGFVTTNPDKLIEAAKKIETYLKENNNAKI